MVAAQVRAGAEPTTAWAAAVELCDAPLSTTDPVAALRSLTVGQPWPSGPQRGARASTADAAAAAAAWDLAQTTGAPLAGLLDSVARTVRAERDDQAALEAALAGPRATARLLLALPVAGVGLGELVGAHPVGVLLTTAPGRACAVGGVVLLIAGRWWMRALVNAVERAGRPAPAAVVVRAGSS